jgi:hypothetical protein
MAQLKLNKTTGELTLVGNTHIFKNLNTVQMQNIMLKLDYDPHALFECLGNMVDNDHNTCELGMCGGFMYSYQETIL